MGARKSLQSGMTCSVACEGLVSSFLFTTPFISKVSFCRAQSPDNLQGCFSEGLYIEVKLQQPEVYKMVMARSEVSMSFGLHDFVRKNASQSHQDDLTCINHYMLFAIL